MQTATLTASNADLVNVLTAAYRRYEPRLFRAALRITRNEADAWDAVQEGMINALGHAEQFHGDSAVTSWLYTIVVNAALRQQRAGRARRKHDDDYRASMSHEATAVGAASARRDPEDQLHARIDLERAAAQIASLSVERQGLLAEVLRGGTCAEIGAALGEPTAAVKSRLHRVRQSLRQKLTAPARRS